MCEAPLSPRPSLRPNSCCSWAAVAEKKEDLLQILIKKLFFDWC